MGSRSGSQVSSFSLLPPAVWNRIIEPVAAMRKEADMLRLFPEYLKGEELFGLTVHAVLRIAESVCTRGGALNPSPDGRGRLGGVSRQRGAGGTQHPAICLEPHRPGPPGDCGPAQGPVPAGHIQGSTRTPRGGPPAQGPEGMGVRNRARPFQWSPSRHRDWGAVSQPTVGSACSLPAAWRGELPELPVPLRAPPPDGAAAHDQPHRLCPLRAQDPHPLQTVSGGKGGGPCPLGGPPVGEGPWPGLELGFPRPGAGQEGIAN